MIDTELSAVLRLTVISISIFLLSLSPAAGQQNQQRDNQDTSTTQSSLPETFPGEVAQSSAGQAGQRQTREVAEQEIGIEPMARISNRVQNRVQSRIRNRIDRFYNPTANATSPFTVASEQAREAGRSPRR